MLPFGTAVGGAAQWLERAGPAQDYSSWTGDHFVAKLSIVGQPTRPTQPFILPGSINE